MYVYTHTNLLFFLCFFPFGYVVQVLDLEIYFAEQRNGGYL